MTDQNSRHYYQLRGKEGERVVQSLAEKSFFPDWCFPSPTLPNGDELCDMLVLFGPILIVIQVKTLIVGKSGKLDEKQVSKNVRQLSGARRQLMELRTPVKLQNDRRGVVQFDSESIDEVFLLSVLLGETPDFQLLEREAKARACHVFTDEFARIAFSELDTILDFCNYLRSKEHLRERVKSLLLVGGEKDLLAFYLKNGRSFDAISKHDVLAVESGIWESLASSSAYASAKATNRLSYAWDALIDTMHVFGEPTYERIARAFAETSRQERQQLSESLRDAHLSAANADSPDGIFCRVLEGEERVYCFLFTGDEVSRDDRRTLLKSRCETALKNKTNAREVVGIATEMAIREDGSHDFFFLEAGTTCRCEGQA